MAQQHRQIVQLHGLGALDQEVTDVGPDIAFHIVIDAVFYQIVAQAGRDAAEHHRPGLRLPDAAIKGFLSLFGGHAAQQPEHTGKAPENRLAVVSGFRVVVNEQGGPGGQQLFRQALGDKGPDRARRHGGRHQAQHGQHLRHRAHQQRRNQVQNAAA